MTKKKVKKKKISNKKCNSSCCLLNWKFFIPIFIALLIVILLVVFLVIGVGATSVEKGDTVSVNYVGMLEDGTVFDTNIKEVAELNNIQSNFVPLDFEVGAGMMIKGFDEGVVGMHIGEEKKITIAPEEAYGVSRQDLIIELPKSQELERFLEVDSEEFVGLFGFDAKLDEEFNNPSLAWKLKVVEISNNVVTLENLLVEGEPIQMEGVGWVSYVDSVSEDKIVLIQDPKLGDEVILPNADSYVKGIISEVSDLNFEIDLNHPLAGKVLVFDITLMDVKKL